MKYRLIALVVVVLLSFSFLFRVSATSSIPAPPTETEATSLRTLAQKRGISIGAAVDFIPLQKDPNYRAILIREFDTMVPENAWKFDHVHPTRGRYDFTEVDALMAFAKEHNLKMRGHPLAWHHLLPQWVIKGNFTRDQWIEILREHIQTLVGRYQGQVYIWDVVNEAINRDGSLRDTIWLRNIGPEYIDLAYRWTHEADPKALLFYCDYATEELGQKSDAVYDLARGMLQRGVPLNGVGFQAHLGLSYAPKLDSLAKNFQRFGELGLEVQFTELDVKVQDGIGNWEKRLKDQAKVYAGLLKTCLEAKTCTAFTTWGFVDRYTWIGDLTGLGEAPLIFDKSYRPKPAYHAMKEVLKSE
jgi:endo-1,4-beta-xylanase